MTMRRLAFGIAVVICLYAPATAEIYNIDNPASNIYNPATRMNNPNPLSPPPQAVPQPVPRPTVPEVTKPAEQVKEHPQKQRKPTIPQKSYHFKTVKVYIKAAKKAFTQDDYIEFISITEDALRRISAGTLKATQKTKQKLVKYNVIGYRLLENNED